MSADLAVLYEHPEWQKPLFAALDERDIAYEAIDLKQAAFHARDEPPAPVIFNQASPSAYTRGNQRAVPFTLAYLRHLEQAGARVLNGAEAFSLEISKAAQLALLRKLDVERPASIVFNDPQAVRERADELDWPALLKPEQGGSGARMRTVDSPQQLAALLEREPELWDPDGLLLVQELLDHDEEEGIVRMEFLDGELLYAMRVVSRGSFNLCPSEVCNPQESQQASPEFHAFPEVPEDAVAEGRRIVEAAGIDVGAVEYLETREGRRVFYDVNANSNLRAPVAQDVGGFDPFERVAGLLEDEVQAARGEPQATART